MPRRYGSFGLDLTNTDGLKRSAVDTLSSILGVQTYQPGMYDGARPESEGIFGLPKTIAVVGGVVLAGGLILMLAKKKPALSGYRRRRRRSRR